jgi:hypothetical protein
VPFAGLDLALADRGKCCNGLGAQDSSVRSAQDAMYLVQNLCIP